MPGASLFWKLFGALTMLGLLTAGLLGFIALPQLVQDAEDETARYLLASTHLLEISAAPALAGGDAADLADRLTGPYRAQDIRLTVIRADGMVVADTHHDPAGMDNHATRPEVLQAQASDHGRGVRYSATLQTRMLYVARRVERDGQLLGYVRAALSLSEVDSRQATLRGIVFGAMGLSILVSLGIAFFVSRRLTRPLRSLTVASTAFARGEYDRRVPAAGGDELGRMALAFNRMADDLSDRLRIISRDREELRAILAGMEEGVVAVDRDRRVVLMNGAAGRILGCDPGEGVGRLVREVTPFEEVASAFDAVIADGRPTESECTIPEEARARAIQLHAAPLGAGGGEGTQGAVMVLHDISELRRLEQVRQDFVANVSHELKTPLAAIRGFVETILEDEEMDEETRRRFLDRVRRQAMRLGDMVEEVLMLSRLESHSETLERGEADLGESVRDVVQSLLPAAAEAGVLLEGDLPSDPVPVRGTDEALRRIAGNLLDNAVKYTPRGGRVEVRILERPDGVRLEVEDDGIGIPPEMRERVFERFFRVDPGRSRAAGGTGLGLSIVKHLVQSLGGHVGVEASNRGGSLFRVDLPRPSANGVALAP